MRFYATEKLGRAQSLTPEGFLLVEGAALARTGTQVYGPGETPLEVSARDGVVRVDRNADQVFRPATMASFAGKPVVNDHPQDDYGMRVDVTPDNWRDFAVGVVLHPRRGEGAQDDLLIGDLLITDRAAIAAVRAGKRELSCGYDADYIETGDGLGLQTNIIGNHVALVDAGRCGPRCAIGDRDNPEKGSGFMSKLKDRLAALAAAFTSRDEKGFSEGLKGLESVAIKDGELTLDAVAAMLGKTLDKGTAANDGVDKAITDRFDALDAKLKTFVDSVDAKIGKVADAVAKLRDEFPPKKDDDDEDKKKAADETILGNLQAEAPPGATGDQVKKARDSAFLTDSFTETVAMAEILAPGISLPTFDAKAAPVKTFDAISLLRKTALDLAYAQPAGRAIIDQIAGGRAFDAKSLDCASARTFFRAAAGAKRSANNRDTIGNGAANEGAGGGLGVMGKIKTPAEFNQAMRKHYSNVSAAA